MTRAQAIAALDEISVDDPEKAHVMADEILIRLAGGEVADAYRAVEERAAWWAYA